MLVFERTSNRKNKVALKELDANNNLIGCHIFAPSNNILPHPTYPDFVIISATPSKNKDTFTFDWKDIDLAASGITATNRAEFIYDLGVNFFYC